jgi:D-alanyl-lipoteichoic acid acyltransferase DltB (MBOAT superfamily)
MLFTNSLFLPFLLLVGLWHGAGLHYIVWGGLHGLFLSFERLFVFGQRAVAKRPRIRNAGDALRAGLAMVLVFHLVTFTWVFFRADSLADAIAYLARLFTAGGFTVQKKLVVIAAVSAAATLVIQAIEYRRRDEWVFRSVPAAARGLAYAAAIVFCILFGGSGGRVPFIYFQF